MGQTVVEARGGAVPVGYKKKKQVRVAQSV